MVSVGEGVTTWESIGVWLCRENYMVSVGSSCVVYAGCV